MSSFLLKIIACITMFIDHVGYLIFNGHFSFMNFIGRISFPIFAFQISEGYTHTKNLEKYIFKLFIFALISQYPFMLFHGLISAEPSLNIFFTLVLGLICIIIYDKISYKFVSIIFSIGIACISEFMQCDYGFYGVIIILLFYVFKNNKFLMSLSFILCTITKYAINIIKYGNLYIYSLLCICTILPILFINLYNKKQGRKIKYFLYIFYPAHLLLIYLLSTVL